LDVGVNGPGGGLLATEGLPGALGLVLRHRKWLVIGYLALLHFLVYFSMTHGVFTHPHHTVGLYKLNKVDPQLESARFQPLKLYEVGKLVSKFAPSHSPGAATTRALRCSAPRRR
jgi:hypothetical protein